MSKVVVYFSCILLFSASCHIKRKKNIEEYLDFSKIEKICIKGSENKIQDLNTDSCILILKTAHKVEGIWKFPKRILQIKYFDKSIDSIYINPNGSFFSYKNYYFKIGK